MEKTIELIKIQQETLQDVIQYLDRINHSDTQIRHKVDVTLNHLDKLHEQSEMELTKTKFEVVMLVKDALKITDSFTKTSKMPGLSYSLPAWACQTGSKLRKVKTSPCFGCYALKGNYTKVPCNQGSTIQTAGFYNPSAMGRSNGRCYQAAKMV